jgi:hypothetical protein
VQENGWVGTDDLFGKKRQIEFPTISNCVGCFHKKEETIAAESILNPDKVTWFAEKENLGMGTWLDSKKTYAEIMADAPNIAKEVLFEMKHQIYSCDSGGCSSD